MLKVNKQKVPMRQQPAWKRIKNFDSVPLGYNAEEAIAEAKRCLQCKKPECERNCPVNMKIKTMISKIAEGDFKEAFLLLKRTIQFPRSPVEYVPRKDNVKVLA